MLMPFFPFDGSYVNPSAGTWWTTTTKKHRNKWSNRLASLFIIAMGRRGLKWMERRHNHIMKLKSIVNIWCCLSVCVQLSFMTQNMELPLLLWCCKECEDEYFANDVKDDDLKKNVQDAVSDVLNWVILVKIKNTNHQMCSHGTPVG